MSAVLNQHAVQDSSFLKSAFFFPQVKSLKSKCEAVSSRLMIKDVIYY